MKSTAFLMTIGRGLLVDQAALTAALQSGAIAGAALDVLEDAPPRPDEPLLSIQNVIVTPHTLCTTEDFVTGVADDLVADLIRASRGERPMYAADPPRVRGSAWRDRAHRMTDDPATPAKVAIPMRLTTPRVTPTRGQGRGQG